TLGDGGDGTGANASGGVGGGFKSSQVQMNVVTIGVGGGFVTSNELTTGIHTGSGGTGSMNGGNAGDVSGIHILGNDILFDPDFDILVVYTFIDLGAGGDGCVKGG